MQGMNERNRLILTSFELRATTSLATVFALRLAGLFMIYPVFSAYALHLDRATPAMIGVALGAYGLTQGLLQIPYGLLSDRLGRRPIIAGGLLLFAIGSMIAADARSIDGVVVGRTLQGAGAVGSALLALVADLTREEARTAAMAIVGMTIGLSFAVAIVLGPVLAGLIGVPGIFWLTALFAVVGIGVVYGLVPAPSRTVRHLDTGTVPRLFARVISDIELLRLDFSIFSLHLTLTASFLAMPLVLTQSLNLAPAHDWIVYLPVLMVSIALMVPIVIVAERGGRMKEVFLATVALLAVSQLMLIYNGNEPIVVVSALVAFFTGFNVMEASLPSLVSKIAPTDAKGTAMGIYTSSQFLGIFAGGVGGGLAAAAGGSRGVFMLTLVAVLVWLAIASTMRRPIQCSSYLARINKAGFAVTPELANRLRQAPGVLDAVIAPEESVAYLKIDRSRFDESEIARIIGV